MGLIEELKGKVVSIDTSPFIYFLEKNPGYLKVVRPMFKGIENDEISAVTSTITLIEVLVLPLRLNKEFLAEQYREILLYSKGLDLFEVSHKISEYSAKLRAKYNLRTPDAIQIATGIINNANIFVTNDTSLKKIDEIKVLILKDFL